MGGEEPLGGLQHSSLPESLASAASLVAEVPLRPGGQFAINLGRLRHILFATFGLDQALITSLSGTLDGPGNVSHAHALLPL